MNEPHQAPDDRRTIRPVRWFEGQVDLPPDKSVAHRAALLSALAEGTSHIVNYPAAADPQSTLSCLRQLGVSIEAREEFLVVEGRGLHGLHPPRTPLDCGNAGTLMRLVAGIVAGQPFDSVLTGDASLQSRPMKRIAEPLQQMGARIDLTDGHPPIRIAGGTALKGIEYALPVASAQVKSCVLLAGLYAEGETTVVEEKSSRDHTERMLGLDVFNAGGKRYVTVRGGQPIAPRTWSVPRDFSAAAFFLVAGSIVPRGRIVMRGVGLNPSRSGLLDVLNAMGASITVTNEREHGGEPIADLTVQPAALHGVTLGGDVIPNLIDEIPILAVAAACATGETLVRDAGELRVKETDRIHAIVENLRAMGANVDERADGFRIVGGTPLHGAEVRSFGDHRIAMMMGVAGLVASDATTLAGADCASVSFPGFWPALDALRIE